LLEVGGGGGFRGREGGPPVLSGEGLVYLGGEALEGEIVSGGELGGECQG